MQEDQNLPPVQGSHLRELGSAERLHWVMNLNHFNHFAMAGEVSGKTTPSMWRSALNALQHRHPFLNVCITRNAKSKLVYSRIDGHEIPLTMKTLMSPMQWSEKFENELVAPFDASSAPLMRAVMLHDESKCVIILTTHHTIADGMSLVFIMRDLMQALSGENLAQLSVAPSQEELSSQAASSSDPATPEAPAHVATVPPPLRPQLRNGARPQVHGLRLSPEQTMLLAKTAREEKTTIHAALCAALVLAGRNISPSWRERSIRVLSPISLRKSLNAGEGCVLAVASVVVPFEPSSSNNFWEFARWAKQSLLSAQATRGQAMPEVIERAIAHDNDADALAHLLSLGRSYDMAVTNVQRVPFDNKFGNLSLEGIWGPSALNGHDGEQAVAVATVADSLHLSHTSYTPFHSLLEKAAQLLLEACSQT